MKNNSVDDTFLRKGGADASCMSTSFDLDIIGSYAKSANPLIFRIKVDSPMQMGADLEWLSCFPEEKEVLYPPLTYLKPMFTQKIKNLDGGVVVTVSPNFPS